LVKIRRTSRGVRKRAKELSTTRLPDSFHANLGRFFTDADAVEDLVRNRLGGYRYRNRREFFRVPVKEAILALMAAPAKYRLP
jgi:hypothetical protein